MGNFATYARFNLTGSTGLAPLFELTLERDGQLAHGKVHSFTQRGEGGPKADQDQAALRKIISLTKSDIGYPFDWNIETGVFKPNVE